jgi:hypothetical protein
MFLLFCLKILGDVSNTYFAQITLYNQAAKVAPIALKISAELPLII